MKSKSMPRYSNILPYFHFGNLSIGERLLQLYDPVNDATDHIGVWVRDLHVIHMEDNGTLFIFDYFVGNAGIIRVHKKPFLCI